MKNIKKIAATLAASVVLTSGCSVGGARVEAEAVGVSASEQPCTGAIVHDEKTITLICDGGRETRIHLPDYEWEAGHANVHITIGSGGLYVDEIHYFPDDGFQGESYMFTYDTEYEYDVYIGQYPVAGRHIQVFVDPPAAQVGSYGYDDPEDGNPPFYQD